MSEEYKIVPLVGEGLCDYHCHCDFSVDAVGSIDEYCQTAIRRNLAELCFTTHYDTNYKVDFSDNYMRIDSTKVQANPDNLQAYVDAVHRAQDAYYPLGLSVKLGLEFGWYETAEKSAEEVKKRYDFDYFLCGLHQLEDRCFWSHDEQKGSFDLMTLAAFAEKYFASLTHAAESGLFDSIAHFDYYKRKAYEYYGNEVADAHQPHLEQLFAALKKSDTGIEINTAAQRHGLDEYYPKIEIINAAKKAGVKVIRTGSDAHHPGQVGYDFELAAALIPSMLTGCED